MKREKLQKILLEYYTLAMCNMILRGIRKPSYETMCELNKKLNIPFDVWLDINSYIENDTKKNSCSTTTN